MKKLLILPLMILSLFVSVNKVKADETTTEEITMSNFYRDFDDVLTDINSNNSIYSEVLNVYNTTYAETYPYFMIVSNYSSGSSYPFSLIMWQSQPITSDIRIIGNGPDRSYEFRLYNPNNSYASYGWNTLANEYQLSTQSVEYYDFYNSLNAFNVNIVISNFNIVLGNTTSENITDYVLQFPPFTSSSSDFSTQYFELTKNGVFPTYMNLYTGDYLPSISYTTINLNNYPYVALSLKNYNYTDTFSTTFMVEGQLCLTPIYNYGMTEKASSTYQVERCSPVYNTFTPVYVSILDSDISNHAIYYLKAYNTSINNIIKVDTSIFNITYITSENENNPSVVVGGRSYPTIPYNELTSSATQSEEEGYVSGRVENVFDVSSDSNFITDLFSNPLEGLNTVWKSILSMFALIGSFIALLPETMQVFLYTSFSLGLVLGLIKILIS